ILLIIYILIVTSKTYKKKSLNRVSAYLEAHSLTPLVASKKAYREGIELIKEPFKNKKNN
ncbi:class C sortase, partial [Streptococcus pyogenes]